MRSSSRAAKSSASSQETGLPRKSGVVSRSGEYCSGRKLFVRQQRNPWVTGCEGSPPSRTTRPFSTCATPEQASGQSRLQTVFRISGLELRILGVSTALSFAAMDFWYAGLRRRISRVYLLNGITQVAFVGAWAFAEWRESRDGRRLPEAAFA